MSKYFSILMGLILLSALACRKDGEVISVFRSYSIGSSGRVNDLVRLNDSVWIACGGERGTSGGIWRSADYGQTWSTWSPGDGRSFYCLGEHPDGTIWAGGEYLSLWKSQNDGEDWTFQWLADQVPVNEEDRPSVRAFSFPDDSSWYVCGGENLGEGIVYHTADNGQNWTFSFYQNEMRAIQMLSDSTGAAGGHGLALYTSSGQSGWKRADWEDDFITGIVAPSDHLLLACSFSGKVYRSNDAGHTWQLAATRPVRRRPGYFDMDYGHGLVLAGGVDGEVSWSRDQGANWNFAHVDGEPNIYSVHIMADDKAQVTSDHGMIYEIILPE